MIYCCYQSSFFTKIFWRSDVASSAVIELARNVCNLTHANSTEINPRTPYPGVDILEEQKNIIDKGGTMRLGACTAYLKPNSRVALNQRNFAIVEVLPQQKDPMVSAMEVEDRPTVAYEDVGGLEEQILELRETVELPLTSPELFEKVGISPPKGVMLYGPPGTGKTLLARAVAHETNATFIRVIGSELVQKFIGEGARLVREIFEFAEEKSPTILFIDELDAIGSRRLDIATSGDREVQRTLMQLLSNLDGFDIRGDVRVIAATNRPDILDPALLRPGRFDRVIEIGIPSSKSREQIFKIHTRKMSPETKIDLKIYVSLTEGASGADIKNICMEAGMFAVRNERDHIINADFKKAVSKVMGKIKSSTGNTGRFYV